jgi:signal transduction histidine kinase/CheY-like chemotaxis protein
LLALLRRRARPARLVFPGAALLLGGCLAIVMPLVPVAGWLAAVGLACLAHWAVDKAYRRWTAHSATRWQIAVLVCAAGYGCAWALSFGLFWAESPETQRQVALMLSAALGVASVPACAPYPLVFHAWFLPVSGLLLYVLLGGAEPPSWELLITWLLYTGLLAYAVRQQHGLVRENLRLNERYQSALHSLTLRTEEAERANRSKARFLAAASHDLRQPMQALSMFVEGLQTTDLQSDQRQLVAQIRKSVGAMSESLREILDISKLDAGVVQPKVVDFPIAQILERVASELRNLATRKALSFKMIPSRCWVSSDPLLLYRIVLNLGQNAIAYTERGRVLIGCRRSGADLRIEVWDTGAGIAPEHRQTIFKEYVRLQGPNREGLGLGLAICDRLARLLSHRLTVRSQVGRGSVFSVTVPTAPAGALDAQTPEPTPYPRLSLAGRSVVLVDDDPAVLAALGAAFDQWGCQVVLAGRGAEALKRLESAEHVPDLVIADYQLADGETGAEVIDAIRNEFNTHIPALLLTADTSQDRVRDAAERRLPLVHKPVSAVQLRVLVTELLDARQAEPADERQGVHVSAARD